MDRLLHCAEQLDAATGLSDAWEVAVRALASLDVGWCHHAYVAAPATPAMRPPALLRLSTLPAAWRAHHEAMGYWRADAAVRHCASSVSVFATGRGIALAAGDAAWAGMCADAEAMGLCDGLAVPLRGLSGAGYGGFSLLTRETGARFDTWRAAHGREAVLLAQLAAHRLAVLGEASLPGPRRLSPRERECLLWLAVGLRSDRIAERLGLARATVDLHLSRARRRLGAATREQAIARAIALGLLNP